MWERKARKKRQRTHRAPRAIPWIPFVHVYISFHSVSAFPSATVMLSTSIAKSSSFRLPYFYGHSESHDFLSTPEAASLSSESKERIITHLKAAGIWSNAIEDSSEQLLLLARDFVDRPEVFSKILMSDFGFPVLEAHQTRALAMAAIRGEQEANGYGFDDTIQSDIHENTSLSNGKISKPVQSRLQTTDTVDLTVQDTSSTEVDLVQDTAQSTEIQTGTPTEVLLNPNEAVKTFTDKDFRSTVVNERARRRKRSIADYNYGLPNDYATLYPTLASELDDYYTFMTQPSTYSQESPIRDATAKVYINHAKLFLGWCCQNSEERDDGEKNDGISPSKKEGEDVSLFGIIPNKDKESADNIIRFVLWLRSRDISVSYEANLLRGIIKLLKFRFAKESKSDPLEGQNTFDDIPIIKEVRKLHRDANQRQRLAPRSSDESKKWITWEDYLGVTKNTKNEVLELIQSYENLPDSERKYAKGDTERLHSLEQIRVAEAYQRYLILAILASIPDRQRTIRELEVGRTLMKDPETGCWVVKHGPGDYKTGKHYGERPAMQLAEELTPAIDDFLENWRPALKPSTNMLLVQSKTGKPMTSNSVFKRVVRCCFKYTGKSVNPHLLRDIIVTHVRETEASEKELEALALYMGHSIQMQRTSYDRRTLSTKIAPAVKLMKTVNQIGN